MSLTNLVKDTPGSGPSFFQKTKRFLIGDEPNQRFKSGDDILTYVAKNYADIGELVNNDPQAKSKLMEIANESYKKYDHTFKDGGLIDWGHKIGKGFSYVGDLTAVANLNPLAGLPSKVVYLLATLPEKAYSLYYGVRTGDYLGAAQNILGGILSFAAPLGVLDRGLKNIANRRMVEKSVVNFKKYQNTYVSPDESHLRLLDDLGAKDINPDRLKRNMFKPNYEVQKAA